MRKLHNVVAHFLIEGPYRIDLMNRTNEYIFSLHSYIWRYFKVGQKKLSI